jgi:glycosyltransferase 2 family protein
VKRQRWLRLAWKWLPLPFFALVAWLLYRQGAKLDWHSVRTALVGYRAETLWTCAALALGSYCLYAGYELLARRHVGHRVSLARTVVIAMTSYAFNLNIGTIVGGAGFRFRLYSRSGLRTGTITRLVAFCIATNWVGYIALAGGLFAFGAVPIPDDWRIGGGALRALGFFLLAVALAYLAICAFSRERTVRLGRHAFALPSFATAVAQFALSIPNWLALAMIMWVLLDQEVPFALVLGALLLSAIAGALAHVPGALGVLEAVFFAVIGDQVETHRLAAALVAYRVVYYLAPLVLAIAAYAALEWLARRRPRDAGADAPAPRRAGRPAVTSPA